MIDEVGGGQTIPSKASVKGAFQIQMILQEIGEKKKKEEENVEIDEVKEGVIEGIIENVQNDETASITLSTSWSVNNGKTGIDTISSQSCSVNSNCPLLPWGWSENTGCKWQGIG